MKNASAFHKQVGDILLSPDGPFSGYTILQEIPVKNLCPSYRFKAHRFDWFIKELGLIIEVHGQQHYSINFDFDKNEASIDNHSRQKYRDIRKAEAAISMGYTYIEIPYWEIKKINALQILLKYISDINPMGEK